MRHWWQEIFDFLTEWCMRSHGLAPIEAASFCDEERRAKDTVLRQAQDKLLAGNSFLLSRKVGECESLRRGYLVV